jgi:ABC-type Mn2+/Zn2+ transport system ATPase subunit
MRLKSVEMTWFRGAAASVTLDTLLKSVVIYGENGAGKSSFVDAVEFVMSGGKIRHLAYEYSGRRQEKGIINTHKPKDEKTKLKITFDGDAQETVEIESDGKCSFAGINAMKDWDLGRTILRQNEVADFIHGTKGQKYSVLLPLFGLQKLEIAANNIRQLTREIERQFEIEAIQIRLRLLEPSRKRVFGDDNDNQIVAKIEALHTKHAPDKITTIDYQVRCDEIVAALETRIGRFNAEQRRYLAIKNATEIGLKEKIDSVQTANTKLAGAVEPMIKEKLEVLQSTSSFASILREEKEIQCPACGQLISTESFKTHVADEQKRLQDILEIFNSSKAVIGLLSDNVKLLKLAFGKAELKSWRVDLAKGEHVKNLKYLDEINAEALRTSCTADDLTNIQLKLLPLIEAAASACKDAPSDVQELSTDKQIAQTAKEVFDAEDQKILLNRAVTLTLFLNTLEEGVRDEIKLRCQSVISEISEDIRGMWGILHPSDGIQGIQLYVPEDSEKAIDIGLKFYDVNQDSPRLTLSEGYRNSLGLCIFLAMAKREKNEDRPLFLDDVVVNLDRNHRGMIVELLQKKFDGRQIIVFTHDREWYTELRQQLDAAAWGFKVLMPYETPNIGIRWSAKSSTFDDARAQLKDRPDAAGNDVRKIMDIELAMIADRLQIRMPYMRGERNDRRMAHDFLERFIADGANCFQKKGTKDYETYNEAIEAFKRADKLLLSWANRSSHTFNLVPSEATELIEACELALEFFKCPSCHRAITLAVEAKEWTQCQCGSIRWRYGKG